MMAKRIGQNFIVLRRPGRPESSFIAAIMRTFGAKFLSSKAVRTPTGAFLHPRSNMTPRFGISRHPKACPGSRVGGLMRRVPLSLGTFAIKGRRNREGLSFDQAACTALRSFSLSLCSCRSNHSVREPRHSAGSAHTDRFKLPGYVAADRLARYHGVVCGW